MANGITPVIDFSLNPPKTNANGILLIGVYNYTPQKICP